MAFFYRAQVSIRMDTGLPEDASTNTWHFDSDEEIGVTEDQRLDHIKTRLTAFYQAIDGVLFPQEVGATADLKVYRLDDPEPRAPRLTTTIDLTNSTQSALPSEVAMVLSYQATKESGESQARRRGRIYIGPLAANVGLSQTGGSRPSTTARTTLANAAAALRTSPSNPGRPLWAVFSPTEFLETGSLAAAMNDVDNGWVDDAFDTQRRRGLAPTTRQTWV